MISTRLKIATQLLGAFLLCWTKTALAEHASHTHEYDSLKALYQTLRNTDPNIERVAEWHSLSERFEDLAKNNPRWTDAPNSYVHAALLDGEIFSVLHDMQSGHDAVRLWTLVETDFPRSSQAEDSLLKLGEMQHALGDNDSARAAFEDLRKRFPESALSAIAAAHELDLDKPASEKKNSSKDEKTATSYAANAPIVVLDPGHGGEDFGASGQGGLLEKDVALAVAFDLMSILRKDLGAKVLLTRRDDTFIPLATRMEFANNAKADIFISLHANATPTGKSTGVESYILDNSNDKSSKLLATRENATSRTEDQSSDLQYMLSDLVESSKLPASKSLAQDIQDSIISNVKSSFGKIADLGVKKAPFYVLVGAHMPSVLVEMAFIDNAHDGKLLADKQFRHAIAVGIANGAKEYIQSASGKQE